MQTNYPALATGKQASDAVSTFLLEQLTTFLAPLLLRLDAQLDKRLVRTFQQMVSVIIRFRHNRQGLLLSELGAYLLSPSQAPAGTKRLSNLLRCTKWTAKLIEEFLWQQGDAYCQQLAAAAKDAFCIWDESELEKAESIALEGLCAVPSSKARRLKRIKPGFFNPPGGRPVFVPGMHWLSLLLVGLQGPPVVAAMRWWTTRGPLATDRRTVEKELLGQCVHSWGRQVTHIFDRGFAGSPWLGELLNHQAAFVLRWPKTFHLLDKQERKRSAWKLLRGQRSWEHRELWDARRHCHRRTGILAALVRHPDYDQPLWLVVSRPGVGRSPWYLLTNQPVSTPEQAWHIVLAYARRWQIEMTYRYAKSELAMESPRLWSWDNRLKLLLIATLAYAFLLSLLATPLEPLRHWLLRFWCHRTGKRYRDSSIPLYRLRSALSQLWLAFSPPFYPPWENSG